MTKGPSTGEGGEWTSAPFSWALLTLCDIGSTREPGRKRLRSQPQALRLMGKDAGSRVGWTVEVGIHCRMESDWREGDSQVPDKHGWGAGCRSPTDGVLVLHPGPSLAAFPLFPYSIPCWPLQGGIIISCYRQGNGALGRGSNLPKVSQLGSVRIKV